MCGSRAVHTGYIQAAEPWTHPLQVELVQAVEAVEVRTREDELVYAITAAFAVAQVRMAASA